MAEHGNGRNVTRAEDMRYGLAATTLAVTFMFLMFFRERDQWSWRLVLLGLIIGPSSYSLSVSLRLLARSFLRRTPRVVANLLMAPFDFACGSIAFLAGMRLLGAVHLLPLRLDAHDERLTMYVVGAMTTQVGVLFYLFNLTNKRLMRSVKRIKDQELAERELELARSIQQRLLPPQHLAGIGYEIRARNLAAHYVAGDFYDVFRLGNGALGIAIADVSGKGLGASLIMATVKAILPLVAEGRAPAAALSELSARLHRQLPPREFVALAYAQFDPMQGLLEIANAGLPDPYLLRRGGEPEVLSVPGPRLPIGIRKNVAYESLVMKLEIGDAMLAVTDGLVEAFTPGGEQLGYDAMFQIVRQLAQKDGDALETLFTTVDRMTTPKHDDDWTGLLLCASAIDAGSAARPRLPSVSDKWRIPDS